MCRLRNITMRDYQESVTTGQTHRQTDAGQIDTYVPLCFAGDTKIITLEIIGKDIILTSLCCQEFICKVICLPSRR